MPLRKHTVHLPVGGGHRGDVDDQLLEPPEMRRVVNMEFDKRGRLRKRHGYTQLDPSGAPAHSDPPVCAFDVGGELAYRHTTGIHKFSITTSDHVTYDNDTTPPNNIESDPVFRSNKDMTDVDVAVTNNGFRFYIWVQDNNDATTNHVWYIVTDSTGSVVHGPGKIDSIELEAWVVPLGNQVILMGVNATPSLNLLAQSIDLSTGPAGPTTSWTTVEASAVGTADLVADQNDTSRCFAVYTVSPNTYIKELNTSAAVVQSYNDSTPSGVLFSAFYDQAASQVFAVTADTGVIKTFSIPTTFTSWSAGSTVITPTGGTGTPHNAFMGYRDSSNNLWVVSTYEDDISIKVGPNDSSGTERAFSIEWINLTSAGAATGTQGLLWHYRVYTRPFLRGDTALVGAAFVGASERHVPVSDWSNGDITLLTSNVALQRHLAVLYKTESASSTPQLIEVSRLFPFLAEEYSPVTAPNPGETIERRARWVWSLGDYFYSSANVEIAADLLSYVPILRFRGFVGAHDARSFTKIRHGLNSWNISMADIRQSVAIASNIAVISGGVCVGYDGVLSRPMGFPYYPQIVAASGGPNGVTSALGVDGYVHAKVIFVYTDAKGNKHRSAASNIGQVPFQSTSDWDTLRYTFTRPPIMVDSEADLSSTVICELYTAIKGDTFKKTADVIASGNDPFITISLDRDDTIEVSGGQLIGTRGGALLYSEGGELESHSPSGLTAVAVSNDRVWGISGDRKNHVYYTKPITEGIAPEWSLDQFVFGAEEYVGIGELDDKTILFARDRIDLVYGDGPSPIGEGAFIGPQLLVRNIGCLSPHSIVSTSVGIFFQSTEGIHLIGRDLQASFIGEPVSDIVTESYNEVVSAVDHPRKKQVRFLLSGGDIVVFDYSANAWTKFTVSFSGAGDPRAMVTWTQEGQAGERGRNTIITDDYKIFYEDESIFYEPTQSTLDAFFETGWINLAGIGGRVRLRRLLLTGRHLSGSLRVQIAYDHEDSWVDTHDFGQNALNTSATGEVEVGLVPSRKKCKSFKLKVITHEDTNVSGDQGEGTMISGLTVELGLREGSYKYLPNERRK